MILTVTRLQPSLMFDGKLRDKLLFEDKGYTYSRRYFWAFQTLATMNDSIEAMIATYKETFTDEVWTGENKYIWPGTKDKSSRCRYVNCASRRWLTLIELKQLAEEDGQSAQGF